ncbi:MAG TPA: SWIM zinc finger family protein [Abditibacteriaceae bacterium]|nr:SWIM zinc finger family protein [Abditibacteriaceae bacterium]
MAWDYYDGYFPKSTPRQAKGGIKAQSKRGGFGESWWAKRWIQVLETFNIGSRLSRGRSYARSGQVLSVEIEPGLVKAKVQGSRPKPYNVRIRIETLAPQDGDKLAAALSSQVLFTAKLLAGEMPQDIEQVFTASALSLFPERSSDLNTECSCPDWSNPCKHVAAVYYLLGEEFDRDPFLLFRLRGIDRERLTALLETPETVPDEKLTPSDDTGSAAPAPARRRKAKAATAIATPSPAPEPLSPDATVFWQGAALPDDFWGEAQLPPINAALPRRLGNFPFWRGERPLLETIEPIYAAAAPRGLSLFSGELDKEKEKAGSSAKLAARHGK